MRAGAFILQWFVLPHVRAASWHPRVVGAWHTSALGRHLAQGIPNFLLSGNGLVPGVSPALDGISAVVGHVEKLRPRLIKSKKLHSA